MQEFMRMMEDKGMKREYQWARRIIVIFAMILSMVFLLGSFGNGFFELLPIAIVAVGAVWLACLVSTGVSRKMIQKGDKISNGFLRGMYYFLLLPLMLGIGVALVCLLEVMQETKEQSYNYEPSLGADILVFLLSIACVVFVLVPYVQSLLVLILRKTLKKKGEEEEGQESIEE